VEVGTMLKTLSYLIADETGSTAVEYGLIAAIVAIAAIMALSALGISLQAMVQTVTDKIDGVVQASGGTN
jgi:pilus assembly protein Flp/PilA